MLKALRAGLPLIYDVQRQGQQRRTRRLPDPVANAGLELSRYLPEIRPLQGEHEAQRELLDRVCHAPAPAIYKQAYDRWRAALQAGFGANLVMREFRVQGRLIVDLGGESVHETAITLHRLYGTPLIPGSALKGLLRHFAETTVAQHQPEHALMPYRPDQGQKPVPFGQRTAKPHEILFGSQEVASYLTFFDAWYIPDSAPNKRPLRRDVITVHHPRYYQSRGERLPDPANPGQTRPNPGPWDFDDPTPVPFVSAVGNYLVAIAAPGEADQRASNVAQWALDCLTVALADWGVGAKTASGYGRLVPANALSAGMAGAGAASGSAAKSAASAPSTPTAASPGPTGAAPSAAVPSIVQSLLAIPDADLPARFDKFGQQWALEPDPTIKRVLGQALWKRIHNNKPNLSNAAKGKRWYAQLKQAIDAEQGGQ